MTPVVPPRGARTARGASSPVGESLSAEASGFTKGLVDGDLKHAMDYSDFMFQLGLHYQLPERPEAKVASRRVVRTRRWLVACAIVLTSWAVAARVIPDRPPERVLPYEVLGSWRTATPPYTGRGFTLFPDRIVFRYGAASRPAGFLITAVSRRVVADTSLFEIRYLEDESESRMTFGFVDAAIPTISLPNAAGAIWTRVTPDSSP
jgi:hypothetical protein